MTSSSVVPLESKKNKTVYFFFGIGYADPSEYSTGAVELGTLLLQWNLFQANPILRGHPLLTGHQLESLNVLALFIVK